MNRRLLKLVLGAFLLTAGGAQAREPEVLMWDDMVPKQEVTRSSALPDADGMAGADDMMLDFEDPFAGWDYSNPVESLDGKYVKIPGFIVPLESDEGGLLDEFLLVPYYGACIHTPAPPPNQVVYISLDDPFNLTSMYDAYWITGTIRTQRYVGMMADSVYRLEGQKVEKYEY